MEVFNRELLKNMIVQLTKKINLDIKSRLFLRLLNTSRNVVTDAC
jgi:hypothetical protein